MRNILDIRSIREYWQIGSVFISLVVCLIYFVIENNIANQKIIEMYEQNEDLKKRLIIVETDLKIIESHVDDILELSPELMEYRIDALEGMAESNKWRYVGKR
jgi:hypothetical protein